MKAHIVKSNFVIKAIRFLSVIGMAVATAAYVLLFICVGVAPFKGVPINVLSVFDILLDLRYVSAASTYTTLVGAAFAVWFIIASIRMIRLTIRVFGYVKSAFSTKEEDGLGTDWLLYLLDGFGSVSYWMILFVVVLRMFFTFSLSETALVMLGVGIGLHILFRVCVSVVKNRNVSAALYEHVVCTGLFLMGVALLMNFLCSVDTRTTLDAFRVFNVIGVMDDAKVVVWIFDLFVKMAMLIIMQIMALRIINESAAYMNHRAVSYERAKQMLIWMIVLTAMGVLVFFYAYGDPWMALRSNAAGLASAGLLFFVRFLPDPSDLFKVKVKSDDENEEEDEDF